MWYFCCKNYMDSDSYKCLHMELLLLGLKLLTISDDCILSLIRQN